jgi:hydrogenase nickel incorporation protein HypB
MNECIPVPGFTPLISKISKVDLAPYLDIDLNRLESNVRQINPQVTIIRLSAKTGEGLETWLTWLRTQVKDSKSLSNG